MSLRPDDRKGRSRSKSPAGKRERSCSNVRAASPGPQYYSSADAQGGAATTPQYEVRQPSSAFPPAPGSQITMGGYADLPPHERPGYMQQQQAAQQYQQQNQPPVQYAQANIQYAQTPQYGYTASAPNQPGPNLARTPSGGPGGFNYAPAPDRVTFTAKPVVPSGAQQPAVKHTTQPTQPIAQPNYQDYAASPQSRDPYAQAPPPPPQQSRHSRNPSAHTYDGHNVVEITPGGGGGKLGAPPSPGLRPHSLSVSGQRPEGLTQRMDRLSVSGNRPDIQTIVPGAFPGAAGSGGLPPPSPLLEAYHGTYQSISPLPTAMMLDDDDIDHLAPLDSLDPRASGTSVHGGRHRAHSTSRRSPSPPSKARRKQDKLAVEAYGGGRDRSRSRDRRGKKEEKRVKIYDAEEDALALVEALSGRTPDAETLVDIIPALSHDQLLDLRTEYKRHCKVQGRGINIAKHIKLKTTGNFGKICYVTALGRYESEGYWANYWYQSNSARRELLIEALMGRQNFEIREIKDAFKDKRYSDSLTRCMDKELKADKFRKAVLMALEGDRQEESDIWPIEYRNRDVDGLYKALKAREGGESAMLSIVVMRSDAHLREVLRTYERKYQGNFARDALRKSNNLVGEVIAHILNGVINRPARDAMLLHHALMDLIEPANEPGPRSSSSKISSKDAASSKHDRQQRYELVISRLVRLHWDRLHLMRVKAEYEEKYGRLVEEDVEEATKGDFREFCIAICQTGR